MTATIEAFEIEVDVEPTAARFKERLGFDVLSDGRLDRLAREVIWFPCSDSAGNKVSCIARPLPSIGSAKFLNPTGKAFPFIPSQTWTAATKPNKPIIITEGPVKALALLQAGRLSIGVGGSYLETRKEDDVHSELVPALREFAWSGRLTRIGRLTQTSGKP
jgi:hypothetical protein